MSSIQKKKPFKMIWIDKLPFRRNKYFLSKKRYVNEKKATAYLQALGETVNVSENMYTYQS